MKTIKITIGDQSRSDLDFLGAMLEKTSMDETVEALISNAVLVQVALHEATVKNWPEFSNLRPARVLIPDEVGAKPG